MWVLCVFSALNISSGCKVLTSPLNFLPLDIFVSLSLSLSTREGCSLSLSHIIIISLSMMVLLWVCLLFSLPWRHHSEATVTKHQYPV